MQAVNELQRVWIVFYLQTVIFVSLQIKKSCQYFEPLSKRKDAVIISDDSDSLNQHISYFKFDQMGQQCCQVATNDDYLPTKILLIRENDFQLLPAIDLNHPLLKQKIPDLESHTVFRNQEENRYFIGNWKNGQPDGQATLYIPDHLLYQGTFQNATPQGEGQMMFLNKNQEYKGTFHKGKANGQGLYKNNTKKFTFEGQWNDSKPLKGILMFDENPNILKIEIQNFQTGKAHISYKDGRQYRGQIHKQLFVPEGQGELKFLDGSSYNGGWKNGLMHGYGVYQWKDGSKYQGSYIDGKKQGNGVFYYTSGKQYVGMWANGKQQGFGKIVTKNNEIQKEGIWKNGTFEKKVENQPHKQEQNHH